MRFIEQYIQKCLLNKGFHIKTSILAGTIIAIIFFIFNVMSGYEIKVAAVVGIITIVIFSVIWFIVIKRLNKTFEKQIINVEKNSSMSREEKRENAKRLMEKRNNKKNKKK